MTSRERVLKAICFEEPDRVPIDLGAMRSTGVMASAYAHLKEYLGTVGQVSNLPSGRVRLYDWGQQLAEIEEPIRQRFGIDVIPLEPPDKWAGPRGDQWKPWKLFDGTVVEIPIDLTPVEQEEGDLILYEDGRAAWRMPKDGLYFDYMEPGPPAGYEWVTDVDPEHYVADRLTDETLEVLEERSRELFEGTEYAILGGAFVGGCFGVGAPTLNDWMCAILTEKDYIHDVLDRVVDRSIENVELWHQAVGDRSFAFWIADDWGTQRGEWIRPELFDEMIRPHYKRLCDYVHDHTPYKVWLHCCGSVYHVIESFIDAGIDILNPVQTSAANMEPRRLKEEFGGRIVFWGGGCDTQQVLPFGTPDEVAEHVAERVKIFAPGGGFVFNQVHNVQAGVPPENIIAMLDAAYRAGGYPILA